VNDDILLKTKNRIKADLMSNLTELLERSDFNQYKEIYTGIVEDNRDPDLEGKCKIRCYGLHDNIPTNDLPWALPSNSFVGSKKGSFIVPTVGTILEVVFDSGDIYTPKYTTKVLDRKQKFDADKDDDYPNTMIFFETDKGDYFKMNRRTGEAEFYSTAGFLFSVTSTGKVSLSTFGSSEGGDLEIDLTGNCTIDVLRGDVNIKAQNVTVESFGNCDVKANKEINISTLGDMNLRTQNISIEPLNIGEFKGNIGSVDTIGITVEPNFLGGPFNCLMFDPVTCAPHQGTTFTGISTGSAGLKEIAKDPDLVNISINPKTLVPITSGVPLPSLVKFNFADVVDVVGETL
jgi:Type VI secretion system/phage-baseplate injector OB domain